MTIEFLFSSLRRYWWVIIAGTLLGGIAAVALSTVLPKSYEASAQLLLTAPKIADPNDASIFVRERMPTYAALIESKPVLDNARQSLGLEEATSHVSTRVSARVEAATVLITLTAEAENPEHAAELANGVARAYANVAPRLENNDNPILQVDIVEAAVAPDQPSGLSTRAMALIGAMAGLTVGLLSSLLWSAYAPYARDTRDIARATETDVVAVLPPSSRDEDSARPRSRPLAVARRGRGVRLGGQPNPFAQLYSRLGLGCLASRPRVLVVVPTAANTSSASVAAGLAETCLASGQHCVVVAATADNARVILQNKSLSESSPMRRANFNLLTPEGLQMSEGGVLTLDTLEAALLMVSDGVEVVIVAAQDMDADANTRTFLKLGGDVLLTTPLRRPRMRTLRQTANLIRQSGASVVAVAATASQDSHPPTADPAGLEPELIGTKS
jgi:capsular polysaccharide biosynthesis protein